MRWLSWFFVALGVAGLMAVRYYESRIFYDPFLVYFHETGTKAVFPDFEWGRLIAGHLVRFALNLFFSVIIVHFMFKNKRWTWQAVLLICLVFAITFPIYLYCIHSHFEVGALFSFYVRRFVIQPLALLLIIPMFYYRKKTEAGKI